MHAGFGIGAMMSVQLLKPFLKFNRILEKYENSTTFNATVKITSEDIKLQIPYTIAGLVGVLTMCTFLIAQYFESRQIRINEKVSEMAYLNNQYSSQNHKIAFSERLFNRNIPSNKHFCILLIQLVTVIALLVFVSGYNSILSTYMLTYAIKGPAKFARDEFLTIQTLFWIAFIIGRFSAAFIGFKLNSLYFFIILFNLNSILVVIYNTKLNEIKMFYWFIILILGFFNGPMIPYCIAAAKAIFTKANSLMMSIFCISLAFGNLLSTYVTGVLLDKFQPKDTWFGYSEANSAYVIPLLLLIINTICCFLAFVSLSLYLFYKDIFQYTKHNEI